MAILFSDNFNRADSTNLGADWTEQLQDWEILANQLRLNATGLEGIAATTTSAHPAVADVSVSAKFVQVDLVHAVIARSTATPDTQYYTENDAANSIRLWKKVDAVYTLLQTYTPTTSANATVRLECEGSVQRVYYNDSLQTPTGADTEITQTGQTGVRTGLNAVTYDFDDFVVRDFRPTAPQVNWPLPVAAAARSQAFETLNLLTTTLGVVVPAPAPFVPVDWSLPVAAARRQVFDALNLLTTTLGVVVPPPAPFVPQLWPIFYALRPSPDFLGRARVEGRDRFFAGEGRAQTPQEWPLTRMKALDRGSFVASSLQTMTMTGVRPVRNDLWPLSRPAPSPAAATTWVQRFQLIPPAAAGVYQPMRMTLLGVT